MENTLLAKLKLPGRTFQLPSRGAFYSNDEVTGEEGEVHVHAMSALAEISLKNPDLLLNGTALNQVFAECIPQIKKPAALFSRDIDAIMLFLRIATYGPEYEINVKHDCEGAKDHSYVVNVEALVQETKFLDATTASVDFTVTMPNGQVVTVVPIRFEHMIKLFNMNAGKKDFSVDDLKSNVVYSLTSLIDAVDGIKDKKMIEGWVRAVTTPYQNMITEAIEKTNDWGPPSSTKIVCRDCQKEVDVELPLNPISFFTG